jgi:hypothetical protein
MSSKNWKTHVADEMRGKKFSSRGEANAFLKKLASEWKGKKGEGAKVGPQPMGWGVGKKPEPEMYPPPTVGKGEVEPESESDKEGEGSHRRRHRRTKKATPPPPTTPPPSSEEDMEHDAEMIGHGVHIHHHHYHARPVVVGAGAKTQHIVDTPKGHFATTHPMGMSPEELQEKIRSMPAKHQKALAGHVMQFINTKTGLGRHRKKGMGNSEILLRPGLGTSEAHTTVLPK